MTTFINMFRVTLTLGLLLFCFIGTAIAETDNETKTKTEVKTTTTTTIMSPSSQSVVAVVNKAITPTQPYSTGGFSGTVTYSVSPELPSGLSINSKGMISGSPKATLSATKYIVSATGAKSGKAQATVNISITTSIPVTASIISALNCLPATLSAAEEGRRAYMRLNCYSCHGDKGAGGMGPNISGAESGDVQEAVISGAEGGMPAFKNYLCPNDISYLSAYLQVIGSKTAPTFKQWWIQNPTQ